MANYPAFTWLIYKGIIMLLFTLQYFLSTCSGPFQPTDKKVSKKKKFTLALQKHPKNNSQSSDFLKTQMNNKFIWPNGHRVLPRIY